MTAPTAELFGLAENEITALLRAITSTTVPDETLHEQVAERFARATWTGIAEPGDRVAGELVQRLGAVAALRAVIDGWPERRITAAVSAAGSDLAEDEVAPALARWNPRRKSAEALIALRQAARFGVLLVIPDDAAWPVGVDDLGPFGPNALWLRGNESTLARTDPAIALVGARAATGYGEHVTMEASAGLVDRGYTIVSGAAYGIDGMAHRAALASSGQTIAILAGGVDRFYPSGHEALLTRIVEKGAVVSELPCGAAPTKWRFLQRNRLIAAASQATIVLEAGWRSGSLNTAGHALSLGRPVGAVPGPVTSAASAGCHRLIREENAALVTTASEMAELAPIDGTVTEDGRRMPHGMTATRVRVTDAMSTRAPRPVDEIARRSGLSIAEVQVELGVMQLEASASERERGWVLTMR